MKPIALLFLVLTVGCDESDAPSTEEQAAVQDQKAGPPPPPADVDVDMPVLPDGEQYKVNTAASSIEFTGAKITKSHEGAFGTFDGLVVLKDDKVLGTQFSIDLTSTSTDTPKLTTHLLSKDFFHVEKYTSAQFVSSEIIPASEPGAVTHDVRGVLDLHGKQRPLSFPASINVGASATTVSASFDINRQNWGISYPGKPDNLIKDDVQIRINLVFGNEPSTNDGEAATEAKPEETKADVEKPADATATPTANGEGQQ